MDDGPPAAGAAEAAPAAAAEGGEPAAEAPSGGPAAEAPPAGVAAAAGQQAGESSEGSEGSQHVDNRSRKKKKREEKLAWKKAQRQKAKQSQKEKGTRDARKKRWGNMADSQREGAADLAARAAMEAAGQANGAGEPAPKKPNRKAVELADFKARCRQGTTVVLDLEWEEDMTEREVRSLCQQLLFCYGVNRGARRPVRMVLSGLGMGTSTSQRLRKISGFESWPIEVLEGPYIDRFKREELVYLTADAEETIQTFDPEKVYIIGGIVDHNRLKGCTLAKAADQGIASAQLPLSQHIDLGASRRVLTVNHVLQIVVEYQLTGDWRQTFEKCVPGRKKQMLQGGSAAGSAADEPEADGAEPHAAGARGAAADAAPQAAGAAGTAGAADGGAEEAAAGGRPAGGGAPGAPAAATPPLASAACESGAGAGAERAAEAPAG